jgi:tetratricopeptide (TPR) repeat protein
VSYEDPAEENRREYTRWLNQQRDRRQAEEWGRKRLETQRWEAMRDFQAGNWYVGIYRIAGPAPANAYAERMRQFQPAGGATAPGSVAAPNALDYAGRARAQADAGNYSRAIDEFSKAAGLEPNNPFWCAERGSCYLALQRYAEAEDDYSEAITLNPTDSVSHLLRGRCRLELGNFDDAIDDLSRADKLLSGESWDVTTRNNARGQVLFWRGVASYRKGDSATAIVDLSVAISMHPDWAGLYSMRARAWEDEGFHTEAIEDLTAALKLNPTTGDFRARASCYGALGDYAAVVRDLDEAIRSEATAEDYTSRGWGYLILGGREDEALADFETAIGLGDQTPHAYYGRARAHAYQGHVDAALADYDTVIRLDPNHWWAYLNRGRLRTDVGDYEAALADFDEAIRINPTEPGPYMARGDCRSRLGRRKAASEDFLQAADLFRAQDLPERAEEAAARAFEP